MIAPNIFAQIEKSKATRVVADYKTVKTAAILAHADWGGDITKENSTLEEVNEFIVKVNEYLDKNISGGFEIPGGIREFNLPPSPFGGDYQINIGDHGTPNAYKFIIVPDIPLEAGNRIAQTLIGKDAGFGNGNTDDVRWVANKSHVADVSMEAYKASATDAPNKGEKGNLAMRILFH